MAYFYLSICLSAFALFLVEPLIGKALLPWFGGSAAVWSAALLFFQILLTGGYAYAAWLSRGKRRPILHLALLGGSLILMLALGWIWHSPITPSDSLGLARSIPPLWGVFLLLTVSVGLPFFLLSSNSTLVQAWFQRLHPARPAYRLYALSNAFSLLALLVYPVLIESNFSLPVQGWLWSLLYVFFAALTCLWMIPSMRKAALLQPQPPEVSPKPSAPEVLLWVALSACASILLISFTNYLTQQVAVIPFLWVLPLALYLLSFVLAFSGERWYPRQALIYALIPAILLYDLAMQNGARMGVPLQILIFGLVLFLGCLVCNGELYRRRPAADRMPAFYLIISAGAALGGLLVNFSAPVLFRGYWELPLGVLFFCVLFLALGRGRKGPGLRGEMIWEVNLVLLAVAVIISLVRLVTFVGGDMNTSVYSERNFYGVLRVRETGSPGSNDPSVQLINGSTIHGEQFLGAGERTLPTLYYGPTSGVGLVLQNYPRLAGGLRVGGLGLGTGTIAAYARSGDLYRFFELNPADIRIAEGQGGYFTFLQDSLARVEIVAGDARLSLQQEAESGREPPYDVLVVDVFTGDSIPVHLLDEQAFSLYLQRLAPEGVLAVHITNGSLDLEPVVQALADHFHLPRALIEDPGDGHYTSASTWVLLSRTEAVLSAPAIAARAKDLSGSPSPIRLWTDDYSNLFLLLKH